MTSKFGILRLNLFAPLLILSLLSPACTNKFSHPITPPASAPKKTTQVTPALPNTDRILVVENNTLHIFNDQGEAIPDFTPIRGVSGEVKASGQFIAYRTQTSEILHILDTNGNPLSGFHPDRAELFAVSNKNLVYTDLDHHLHVLNPEGSHLPGFAPHALIPVTQGLDTSNTWIGYLEDTRDPAHPRSLVLLDGMGQPFPGVERIPNAVSIQVSDRFAAYTVHPDDNINGERTLHVLNAQGQTVVGLAPLPGVHEYAISDQWIAYTTGNDHRLHVLNARGRELPGFRGFLNITRLKVSNQFIAFTRDQETLHIYNAFGQALPNYVPVNHTERFDVSDKHFVYSENDYLGTHILDLNGNTIQSLTGASSVYLSRSLK